MAVTRSIATRPRGVALAVVFVGILAVLAAASAADGVPPPFIPGDNPQTAAKVELGRRLFYDRRLSATGTFSCARCHQQERAFSDGRSVSIGAQGDRLARNAPSLANVAYRPVLTWFNPQMRRLEDQLMVPLLGSHPLEMGAEPEKLAGLFSSDAEYRRLFDEVFGGDASLPNAARAIAAFERTLISFAAPWDRYRAGDPNAISSAAKRGETLFFSERTQCFRCHPAPHFTDTYMSADLPFIEFGFHDIGFDDDAGARMRAPSLRNVAVTAPYMHDGTVATLTEVIEIYASGGRGSGRVRPTKSAYITGFTLSETEKRDLVAFLESLTDEGFLTDPRFSDPFVK